MKELAGALARSLAVVVVVAAACTGGSVEEHPRIHGSETETWAGSSMPGWRADVPYPFVGAVNVCLDRPGSVEVVDVGMEHTVGGFRVDAYAFRPGTPGAGHPQPVTHTETLWQLGFDPGSTSIDTVCPEELGGPGESELAEVTFGPASRGMTEVGIQFSKPSDRTARGAIIRMTYRSGAETYVHRIGFEMILCEHEDERVPECDFRDYRWP